MDNNEIPINYGSINFYSSISSTLFLILIVIISFYLFSKVIYLTNVDKKYYDYKGILFSDDNFLDHFYNKMINVVLNRKMETINEKLLEKYKKLKIVDGSYNLVNNNVTLDNVELNTINASQKRNLNILMADYEKRLKDLEEIHKENKDNVSELTEIYSQRIKKYVDTILKTLDVIRYQIDISYITPKLNTMTGNLTRLYNSMYNALIQNENINFIKNYYPEFNKDDSRIKPLKTANQSSIDLSGKQDLKSLTEAIKEADGMM